MKSARKANYHRNEKNQAEASRLEMERAWSADLSLTRAFDIKLQPSQILSFTQEPELLNFEVHFDIFV